MKAKRSKLLVIDACVARSAGESEHPVSRSCREALDSIRDICHRIVITEAVRGEWHDHESSYATTWLASMVARRKVKWMKKSEETHLDLTSKILKSLSTQEQNDLRKDLCLVEAACDGDGIIVTRDDTIVGIWLKCHERFGLSKRIKWINPVTDGVQVLECL